MKSIFFLVSVVPLFTLGIQAMNENYIGDKLVSLMTPDAERRGKVKTYFTNHSSVEIWSRNTEFCQVQLKAKNMAALQSYCMRENITMHVVFDDMKAAIDKELKENAEADKIMFSSPQDSEQYIPPSGSTFNYRKYNSYDDIIKELVFLQSRHPTKMRLFRVGSSWEKRPLFLIKVAEGIGLPENEFDERPITWIDAGIHAREWISIGAIMIMLRELLERKNDKQMNKLLKENVFYLVPVFNPDGYEFSRNVDRLWRKTRTRRKVVLTEACKQTCTDSGRKPVGVDANRNFDAQWSGPGSSSCPCSPTYHGPSVESEECIKAYVDLLKWKKPYIKSYWNMHSYYQILFQPHAYTKDKPKDYVNINQVGQKFVSGVKKRFDTRYASLRSALLEILSGVAMDFVHDTIGVPFSYALELRPQPSPNSVGFLLPPEQIEPTGLETLDGIMDSMDEIDNLKMKQKNKTKTVVS